MTQLGSVFEEEDRSRPKGPDLHHRIQVPISRLGHADGHWAAVPQRLEAQGKLVPRRNPELQRQGEIQVFLPQDFPDGGTLRLRGQGGAIEGHRPGDLYLKVELVEPEGPRISTVLLIATAVLLFAAGAIALLRG